MTAWQEAGIISPAPRGTQQKVICNAADAQLLHHAQGNTQLASMVSALTAAAAVSKVAAFALLYFICFKRACIPREEHLSYNPADAVDPAEQLVLQGVRFGRQWVDVVGVAALALYILPPQRLWSWLLWSGLYDSRRELQPWTLADVLSAVLCASGYVLRTAAFDALGRHFTYVVTVRTDHQLVTEGPFQLLMHPSYTGLLMVQMGMAVFAGCRRVWFLMLWAGFALFAVLQRVSVEEAALQTKFGTVWDDYAGARWRLVPYVF